MVGWRTVNSKMRSYGAEDAEDRGEMPPARAVDTVYVELECKKHRVPRREVSEFLMQHCGRGWHHVAGPNGVRRVYCYATVLTDEQKRELLSRGRGASNR
jgi:hypothetical protein